ncbi:MAG: dTDP-4-dehydrorhamnose reductase [Parvularculaceae bacterium]
MRILLFGPNGQVGREIRAIAGRHELHALAREGADLSQPGDAATAIINLRPDAIINAAAWTAVDKAEAKKSAAHRINAEAAGEIAIAAQKTGARLVHISTDYVFSGSAEEPLDETAQTRPINVYGASKLEGEKLVAAHSENAVILRTSWVYAAHGANFVKTMLRLSETRDEVSVVSDQIGGPTPASAIAEVCIKVAENKTGPAGIYHFQGAPSASWAEFAKTIFLAAGRNIAVNKIKTSDYPTPARRPLKTVLDCRKILKDYGVRQPDWRADLLITAPQIISGEPQSS